MSRIVPSWALTCALSALLLPAHSVAGVEIWGTDHLADYYTGAVGDAIIRFDSENPGDITVVGETGVADPIIMSGLDFDHDGNLYAYGWDTDAYVNVGLYIIDTTTGAATFIGGGGIAAGMLIHDLSLDPTTGTMYGAAASGGVPPYRINQLYTIDLDTGFATLVGDIAGSYYFLNIGLATDADGVRYIHDLVSNRMYRIDNMTAVALPQPEGFNANYSQGMTIDWARDGTWYHGAWNTNVPFDQRGQLWTVNPATGAGTFVGRIGAGRPFDTGDIAISPVSAMRLSETSSAESTLIETLIAQEAALNNVTVTGDFESTLAFTWFEVVTIATGPFSGKGFSKGELATSFEGVPYQADWQGALFLSPQDRQIHLKGAVSGEILATVEGYLTESVPDSGVYDQYHATWKIGRLGTTTTSATVELDGTLSYQTSSEFPDTELYVLQSHVEGTILHDYEGPLSTVLTHLRVVTQANPYCGDGFSLISYVWESGSGEGWTYDKTASPGRVELQGFFTDPLFGVVSGTLDETQSARTLSLALKRVDLGLPPMPDLNLGAWGPQRVSPGETITHLIRYSNRGVAAAADVLVLASLPLEADYVSSTGAGVYDADSHNVFWEIGAVPVGAAGFLTLEVRFDWALPQDLSSMTSVLIGAIDGLEADVYVAPETTAFSDEWFEHSVLYNGLMDVIWDKLEEVILRGDTHWGDEWRIQSNETVLRNITDVITHIAVTDEMTARALQRLIDAERILVDPTLLPSILGKWEPFVKRLFLNREINYVDITQDLAQLPEHERIRVIDYISGLLIHEGQHSMDGFRLWFETETRACVRQARFFYSRALDELGDQNTSYVFTLLLDAQDALEYLESLPLTSQIAQPYLDVLDLAWTYYNNQQWELLVGTLEGMIMGIDNTMPRFGRMPNNAGMSLNTISTARDPNVKHGPQGRISPGQTLDYRVEYENEGEGIAFGVYFTDTLDEDVDDSTLEIGPVRSTLDDSVIAPPGSYNPGTRTITWFVGEVGPCEGGYSDFSVNVPSDAPEGTEIINFATVYFPSVPEATRTNGIVSIVSLNQPPVCDAGGPYTAECDGAVTIAALDGTGSSDADDDPLTYAWTADCPGATFDDPTSPTPILTVDTSSACPDGITCEVALTVDDGVGTDTCSATVTIQDTTPPELTCSVTTDVLWSPNHWLVDVGLEVSVDDTCDQAGAEESLVVEVWSDETETPDTGDGTGRHAPDFKTQLESGVTGFFLRNERRGTEDGRVYVIIARGEDGCGNVGFSFCTVVVPHDQSEEGLAEVTVQAEAALATVEATLGETIADKIASLVSQGWTQHGESEELGPHQ